MFFHQYIKKIYNMIQSNVSGDQLSELEKSFGSLPPGAKDSLMGQLSNLSSDTNGKKTKTKSASEGTI